MDLTHWFPLPSNLPPVLPASGWNWSSAAGFCHASGGALVFPFCLKRIQAALWAIRLHLRGWLLCWGTPKFQNEEAFLRPQYPHKLLSSLQTMHAFRVFGFCFCFRRAFICWHLRRKCLAPSWSCMGWVRAGSWLFHAQTAQQAPCFSPFLTPPSLLPGRLSSEALRFLWADGSVLHGAPRCVF